MLPESWKKFTWLSRVISIYRTLELRKFVSLVASVTAGDLPSSPSTCTLFIVFFPLFLLYYLFRTHIMVDVNIQTTIGPYTQEPVCTRPLLSPQELDNVIAESVKAQKTWCKVPLDERIVIAEKWMVSN